MLKKFFRKKRDEIEQNQVIRIEQKEEKGLQDFDDEMYEELEKMKLKVSKLEIYMPEKAQELRKIVDDLEANFQSIEELRAELKIKEEAEKYKAYGEEQLLKDLEQYYEQLVTQQDEFSGIQKNIYISKLKEAKYKLKILQSTRLESYDFENKIEEWFTNRSKADEIIVYKKK